MATKKSRQVMSEQPGPLFVVETTNKSTVLPGVMVLETVSFVPAAPTTKGGTMSMMGV